VGNYELLPSFTVKPVAVLLPLLELTLGIFLVIGFLIKESAVILTALLILFTIVIGMQALKGQIENCGCFNESSFLSTSNIAVLMLRELTFISIGIFIILLNNKVRGDAVKKDQTK